MRFPLFENRIWQDKINRYLQRCSIVHASWNISEHLSHTRAISDTLLERARHMPAEIIRPIMVTIICETIPVMNRSCLPRAAAETLSLADYIVV